MLFAIDFSTIADFYGWLWIIGSMIGAFYVYRASRPYYRKKPILANKKTKPEIKRYTLIRDLPR
jgi:beta-lactamase regulating signal transducer with metallopeptidase domain